MGRSNRRDSKRLAKASAFGKAIRSQSGKFRVNRNIPDARPAFDAQRAFDALNVPYLQSFKPYQLAPVWTAGGSQISSKRQIKPSVITDASKRARPLSSAVSAALHSTRRGLPSLRDERKLPKTALPTMLPSQKPVLKQPSLAVPLRSTLDIKQHRPDSLKERAMSSCKERPQGYHARRAGGGASRDFIPWCERRR